VIYRDQAFNKCSSYFRKPLKAITVAFTAFPVHHSKPEFCIPFSTMLPQQWKQHCKIAEQMKRFEDKRMKWRRYWYTQPKANTEPHLHLWDKKETKIS
jgi:hypothetical protein